MEAQNASMVGAPSIDVHFDSGHEVLSSYWGYLSNGGLVIDNNEQLAVGDHVSLNVVIQSAKANYTLNGKLIRRQDATNRMVIAFDPGQPHDMLLTEALAETDNVPARRHRRFRIDVPAVVTANSEALDCRLVNVSQGGCCLCFHGKAPLVEDARVELDAAGERFVGKVSWARNRECGIQFDGEDGDPRALGLVKAYLASLP
jgi:hypothetical protein